MPDPLTSPGLTSPEGPIEDLLAKMRGGNRDAAAAFIERFGPIIRARYRHKLGRVMRRLFDSQELLSTIGRRLDQYVLSGRMEASSEGELWALLRAIAENSLADKARIIQRLSDVEGEDAPLARDLAGRLSRADRASPDGAADLIDRCLRYLRPGLDREVLSLWLMGHSQAAIARIIEVEPPAVRMRWVRICAELRLFLSKESN